MGGILIAVALIASCTRTPPEQALREAVAGLQASVETRDASALQDYLAEDFIGPEGMDRAGARRMAALYLMRHDRVGVTMGPLDVSLQEQHATVRFTAALTGGGDRFLPDSGRVYAVQTGWRLEDGEWRLTSATWGSER
jgi:ketosteroid isomerase-like protein